jgi:DNA-binding Lrp family transcriptional regulator
MRSMNSPSVDENDLQLISALQDAPRASWAELANILQMGEDTLASRWRKLSSNGLAWISLVDRQNVHDRIVTFVLLQVRVGKRPEVLAEIVAHPEVLTIHCVSGSSSLVLLLEIDGLAETESFITGTLEQVGGIASMQVLPAIGMITSGAHWRTAALSRAQRQALSRLEPPVSDGRLDSSWVARDPLARALLEELAIDGRAGASMLARKLTEEHGLVTSSSTVTRKLTRLLQVPGVRIRCDVSAGDLGWHAVVMLWARVSSAELMHLWNDLVSSASTVRRLLPETRSMAVLAGSVNLHVTAWLHTLDALPEFETRLASWLTTIEVQERSVVFSTVKRMGTPVHRGRRTGGSR